MRAPLSITAVLAGALAVSGCDTDVLNPFVTPVVLPCPDYFILEDAATLTQFRDGPGRDITDIVVSAEMIEVRLGCISHIDEDTDSGIVDLEVSPIIGAEMGAANQTASATIPYFVVITDPEKEILYREELTAEISFANNRTRVGLVTTPTVLELAITPEIRSGHYRVYGGFVLTREQAEFNRKRIRDQLQ